MSIQIDHAEQFKSLASLGQSWQKMHLFNTWQDHADHAKQIHHDLV